MPENKKYLIEIPGQEGVAYWGEERYNANKDALLKDHPDAIIAEVGSYSAEDAKDTDEYIINIPGKSGSAHWNAERFNANRDNLLKDFPNAQIQRVRPIDYWEDQRTDLNKRLEEHNAQYGSFLSEYENKREMERARGLMGDSMRNTPESDYLLENAREYSLRNKEKEALLKALHDNPREQQRKQNLYDSIMEMSSAVEQEGNENYKASLAQYVAEGGNIAAPGADAVISNMSENRLYNGALRFLESAKETMEAPSKFDETNGFLNFMRGAGHTFGSPDFWTFGLTSIVDNLGARDAFEKIWSKFKTVDINKLSEEEIEQMLTPGERALVEAFTKKAMADSERAYDISLGYQSGMTSAESLGFMAQFILTGGVTSSAAKGATKWAAKGLARGFGNLARQGVSKGMMNAIRGAGKFALGTTRSLIDAAVRTGITTTAPKSISEQLLPNIQQGTLPEANKAILKGLGDGFIENWSESYGEILGSVFKAPMNALFPEWSKAIARTPFMQVAERAGFNGYLTEIGEEWFGNAMRTITKVDPNALKDFATVDNQIVTMTAFLPMTLIGGGVSMGQRKAAEKDLENKAANLRYTLEKAGLNMDEIDALVDYRQSLSPQMLSDRFAPLITRIAHMPGNEALASEVFKSAGLFSQSVARYQAMEGGYQAEEDNTKNELRDEMVGNMNGNRFWNTRQSNATNESGEAYEFDEVQVITRADGSRFFIMGQMGDQLSTIDEDGRMGFTTEEELNKQFEDGIITSNRTMMLDQFLSEDVVARRREAEAQRMSEQAQSQIADLRANNPIGTVVNLGTRVNPISGVVVRYEQDKAILQTENQENPFISLSYDQLAQALNTPIRVLNDEQMAAEEAALIEADRAERETELADTPEDMTVAEESTHTAAEFEEEAAPSIIPMNEDGSVDEAKFLEENPEEYVAWNDNNMQDGGADSREQLQMLIPVYQNMYNEAAKNWAANAANPVARRAAKASMAEWQEKIDRINNILAQYNMPSQENQPLADRTIQAELDDLHDGSLNDEEIASNIDAHIAEAQAAYDEYAKTAPVMGTDRQAYKTAKAEFEEGLKGLQQELDYWNEVKKANERYGEMMQQAEYEAMEARRLEAIKARVAELAQKLGVGVNVIERPEDVVDAAAKREIEADRPPLGWFNVDTGKVDLYVPGVIKLANQIKGASPIQIAEETIMHEIVGHKGLRGLLGKDGFNDLCDAVWNYMKSNLGKREQDFWLMYPGVNGDTRKAADEYMAHMAETVDFNEDRSTWEKIVNFIKDALRKIGLEVGVNDEYIVDMLKRSYAKMREESEVAPATAEEFLEESGFEVDEERDDIRLSSRYTTTEGQEAEITDAIVSVTGRSKEDAERWLQSEKSAASIVLADKQYLDYIPDDRYKAIKDNSDYPQGTVDFNNICRKRVSFTKMFTRLQRRYPNRVFTANDLADIRTIMSNDGLTVACGLCYVEDRRQMIGEVAAFFIDQMQKGFEDYTYEVSAKDFAEGKTKRKKLSKDKVKKAAKYAKLIGNDTYVPQIYDLTTAEGLDKLHNEHKGIWDAFQAFNSDRGQQAQNLFQGYAEYKREILGWSKAKVKKVNSLGGLRVFSYSDFEAHHLLDLIQIIIDCAAKGVMIQGYTKVPEFARAVANTGIKLNRSLIPLGDTGIVDGKLAYDPVEGIDTSDANFLESNDNVGNILIGINDEQIRLAMNDPFVHYIIPYHARQAKEILAKMKVGNWTNYLDFQNERNISDGKRVKKGINIYTDVLNESITNDREFVERYLEVCREKGYIPKFDQFLNKDAEGNYVYTPGYHKFLVDFKLFDEAGNILPQKPVVAEFDDAFNMQILKDYAKGERVSTGEQMNATYDKIVEALGLNEAEAEGEDIRFKTAITSKMDAEYMAAVERGDMETAQRMVLEAAKLAMPNTKVVDEEGNPKVVYHGTSNEPFTEFKREFIGTATDIGYSGKGFYFSPSKVNAGSYLRHSGNDLMAVFLNIKNPYVVSMTDKDLDNEVTPFAGKQFFIGCKTIEEANNKFNKFVEEFLSPKDAEENPSVKKIKSYLNKETISDLQQYDGTIFSWDGHSEFTEIVAISPSQIKSADPVTYDNNGNVILLSERFNPESSDIRFRTMRTDEQREQLFDNAKERFGLTNNFKVAGYMLPDGSLLDFSEANDGGDPNQRTQDHREVADLIMDEGREYEYRYEYVLDFVGEGAIRMLPEYAGFQLSVPPTAEQRSRLMDYIYKHNGEVIMEITDENGGPRVYMEYNKRTSPSRIFRDMDGFFNEGIVPGISPLRFRIANENQAIFVSNAAKAVEGIKQEKATPEQWLKMIEKNGGLKAGEDKWMGLSDWLKASDKKTLTKDEVMQFINDNMIVIEEQHYGEINEKEAMEMSIAETIVEGRSIEELQAFVDENAESASRYDDEAEDDDFNLDSWLMDRMVEEFGEDFTTYYTIENGYVEQKEVEWWDRDEDSEVIEDEENVRPIHSLREMYTTKGLRNNHEIALTIPTIKKWTGGSTNNIHFEDAGDGRAVAWIRFGETWEQRPSPEVSRKVLVIDEIQSQRHQEGRDKGYMTKEERAKFDEHLDAIQVAQDALLTHIDMLVKKYPNTDYDIEDVFKNFGAFSAEDKAKLRELKDAYDAEYAKGEQLLKEQKELVEDAPFDKNWAELAMKRMLRYAAENGYGAIAWTKGEQQAKRYSIRKWVKKVESGEAEGFKNTAKIVDIYRRDGDIQTLHVDAQGNIIGNERYQGSKLSDLLGKDIAKKVMQPGEVVLEGENLEGGEGMKGFYDKMLPAFMNKYGKKWGIKVEDINLPNLEDGLTMHSVPVTEEMKESVMEGQLMFSTKSTTFESAITPEVRKEMDVISAQAIVNGNYLKAPNGKDTKLTPEQWALVRTKNFKKWFGDWENDPENASKVVDENGEPRIMHHGTYWKPEEGETREFKPSEFAKESEGLTKIVGYFSADKGYSEVYGEVGDYFLNLRNPLVMPAKDNTIEQWTAWFGEHGISDIVLDSSLTGANGHTVDPLTGGEFEDGKHYIPFELFGINDYHVGDGNASHAVAEAGYDGIMWTEMDADTYMPFDANQIKSATENNGEYSESGDIRFSTRQPNQTAEEFHQAVVDDFKSRYNDIADIQVFPINEETAKRFDFTVDELEEVGGTYVLEDDLIAIFAREAATTSFDVEESIFHELVHKLSDFFEYLKDTGKWMWEAADKYKVFALYKDHISEKYEEKAYHEEMLSFILGFTMAYGGASKLYNAVPEDIQKHIGEILNEIGYDRERESNERLLRLDDESSVKETEGSKREENGGRSEGETEEILFSTTRRPTEEVVDKGLALSVEDFTNLAVDIYKAIPDGARKEVVETASRNDWDLRDAILQMPTSLAMKKSLTDEEAEIAKVIAQQVERAIIANGKELTRPLTTDEALWMLYRASNPISESNPFAMAERAVVADRLGFSPKAKEIDKAGEDEIRFRKYIYSPVASAAEAYTEAVSYWGNRMNEAFVDQYDAVDQMMKAIEDATGKKAETWEDIRLILTQSASKGFAKLQEVEKGLIQKMWDAVNAFAKEGVDEERLARYVLLKHGLERNKVFAQRDARRSYEEEYRAEVKRIKNDSTLTDAEKTLRINDAKNILDAHILDVDNETDARYLENRKTDYSGILAMFADYPGLMSADNYSSMEEYRSARRKSRKLRFKKLANAEAEAQMECDAFESGRDAIIDGLWDSINNLTKGTLKMQYEYGMLSADAYKSLSKMFKYYVPMRGFSDNTGEDLYDYYSHNVSDGYAPAVIGAKGRKSEAESPFGWMAAMAATAIVSGEKNAAKQALYYFAMNRRVNDLLKVADAWYVQSPTNPDLYYPEFPPQADPNKTAAENAQQYADWEKQMEDLRKQGKAVKKTNRLEVAEVANFGTKEAPEHIIKVNIAGEEKQLILNANPRAAQAINGLLNIESNPDYQKVLGKVLRWMSQVSTGWNPEFWMTNISRDSITAFAAIGIKEDKVYNEAWRKNWVEAWKIVKLLPKLKDGTLGTGRLEDLLREAVENGVQTGYSHIKSMEEWDKDMNKYLKELNKDEAKAVTAVKKFVDGVQTLSESMELVSRFATYITSRELGRDITRSVSDAKEVTVNFNRKGSGMRITFEEAKKLKWADGTPIFSEKWKGVKRLKGLLSIAYVSGISALAPFGRKYMMFFNAGVQGVNMWLQMYRMGYGKKVNALAGAAFALGILNSVIQGIIDGDDNDYQENIGDYERRSNLMLGAKGYYLKFALPQELKAFYGLGDILYNYAAGNYHHKDTPVEILKTVTNQLMDIMPINPMGGWEEFIPSMAKATIEAGVAIPFLGEPIKGTNKNFAGAPLRDEKPWLSDAERESMPKYAFAGNNTWNWLVDLAELANRATGGTKYEAGWLQLDPARIQHYAEQATGGLGGFVGKLVSTVNAAFDSETEVKVSAIPFLNKVFTIADEKGQNKLTTEQFYYYKGVAEASEMRYSNYVKEGDKESKKKERNSDEFKIMKIYNKYAAGEEMYKNKLKRARNSAEEKDIKAKRDARRKEFINELAEKGLL